VLIHWNGLLGALHVGVDALPAAQQDSYRALNLLANGFIVSSMLWSTLLIDVIDRRRIRALAVCLLAAALTLVGAIHSPYPDGRLFFPSGSLPHATLALAIGYVLLGIVIWGIDRFDRPAVA
jgi:adenine/guanine/hypoxanthine permease